MKKIFALVLVLVFGVLGVVAKEYADGYISLNVSSIKEVSPNMAKISLAVETTDKDVKKATAENKKVAGVVYTAVKSLLNEQKGEYLQTGTYSVTPQFKYVLGKREQEGFLVKNSISVVVKDVSKVSNVIDKAISAGATRLDNMEMIVENYDAQCDAMLAELSLKAKNKANKVLQPLGQSVAGIKNMDLSCSSTTNKNNSYSRVMMLKTNSAAEDTSSTPIEEGKVKIQANLNVSFFVK